MVNRWMRGDGVVQEAEAAVAKPARPEAPAGRAGGVYVPPFKLAQMMAGMKDKSGAEYQRM